MMKRNALTMSVMAACAALPLAFGVAAFAESNQPTGSETSTNNTVGSQQMNNDTVTNSVTAPKAESEQLSSDANTGQMQQSEQNVSGQQNVSANQPPTTQQAPGQQASNQPDQNAPREWHIDVQNVGGAAPYGLTGNQVTISMQPVGGEAPHALTGQTQTIQPTYQPQPYYENVPPRYENVPQKTEEMTPPAPSSHNYLDMYRSDKNRYHPDWAHDINRPVEFPKAVAGQTYESANARKTPQMQEPYTLTGEQQQQQNTNMDNSNQDMRIDNNQ